MAQDQFGSFDETRRSKIRLLFQRFIVAVVDEYRPNAGGMTAVDVAPPIADHPARAQIDVQLARGAQQHAWLGFAAVTVRCALARVITNFHAVDRQ